MSDIKEAQVEDLEMQQSPQQSENINQANNKDNMYSAEQQEVKAQSPQTPSPTSTPSLDHPNSQQQHQQEEEEKSPKSVVISTQDLKALLDCQITTQDSLLDLYNKIEQILKTLFHLQDIDACYKLVTNFRSKLLSLMDTNQTLKQTALIKLNQFNQSQKVTKVQRDNAEIQRVIKELNDPQGYYTEKKKQYTMHYRKGEDKSLTLKFETLVQIPLFNLITLYYETQLFPLWFPYCKSAKCIHQFSKSKKLSQLVWKSPGPIADRQAFITGFGFNCLEHRECVLILAKSVNELEEYEGVKIPHDDNGRVKLQNRFFGFEMKPISEKLTRVRSIMAFNPNFRWMPQKVLDILTKYFAKDLFEKMMKYAKNFKGTAFQRELEKKRETQFYMWMGVKVEAYFKALNEEREAKKRNKIEAW